LRATFRWVGGELSDPAGWWRDAELLAWIGTALAEPYRNAGVTVVVGPESRGFLVGGLVARELGAGFVEAYKGAYKEAYKEADKHGTPSQEVLSSGPLSIRRRLLSVEDRVLVVDDWLDTGRQLAAVESIVAAAGATCVGAAVIATARHAPSVHALIDVGALD
jgi:adenine phosphoribosyltransferase